VTQFLFQEIVKSTPFFVTHLRRRVFRWKVNAPVFFFISLPRISVRQTNGFNEEIRQDSVHLEEKLIFLKIHGDVHKGAISSRYSAELRCGTAEVFC
jgi:hypothetical protein